MTAASIDIGSNTVLMLIAEVRGGQINPLKEIQRIPRISAGLSPGREISSSSEARLMNVLGEYLSLIKDYCCDKIFISATSAFRKASNREKIKRKIEQLFDSEVKILTGDEEAELAFLGTTEYGIKENYRLVIDIGGGSTEIIYGRGSLIEFRKSFDLGVVSLSEKYFNNSKPTVRDLLLVEEFILNTFNMLPKSNLAPANTIALAGTPAALVCIKDGISVYDENSIEGKVLSYKEISDLQRYLSQFSPSELLNKYPDILKGRQGLILSGSSILIILLKLLHIDNVIVSTKGIRYGSLKKNLILT